MSKWVLIAGGILFIALAWLISGISYAAPLPSNGDFEGSASCVPALRCEDPGPVCEWYGPVPEISTPEGWTVWFRHSDTWGQPEVKVINSGPPWDDPPRVYSGTQAVEMFTFYRAHDMGLFQQFPVEPGQTYVVTAYVHNWCSTDQNDDPHVSDCKLGSVSQYIGIDPGGGIDPFAFEVVWSRRYEIYDHYRQMTVMFEATGPMATVFLRSKSIWGVRNNDAYFDTIRIRPAYSTYLPAVARQPVVRSKLGVHVLRDGTGLRELIAAGPAAIHLVGQWDLSEEAITGTMLIGSVPLGFDAQGLYHAGYTPEGAARMFVIGYHPIINGHPRIDYWTGSNEPVGDDDFMAWYAEEEIWRMQLLEMLGEYAVIGNFATGNPPLNAWPAFLPACEYARDRGHVLGLHEYSTPWLWWMTNGYQVDPDEDISRYGWTTLRYRQVYDFYLTPAGLGDLPLVITEMGLDPMVRPLPPGRQGGAWRNLCEDWGQLDGRYDCEQFYVDQLKWYDAQLRQDKQVRAATIFTIGAWPGPWVDHDIRGLVIWMLTDYLEAAQ